MDSNVQLGEHLADCGRLTKTGKDFRFPIGSSLIGSGLDAASKQFVYTAAAVDSSISKKLVVVRADYNA